MDNIEHQNLPYVIQKPQLKSVMTSGCGYFGDFAAIGHKSELPLELVAFFFMLQILMGKISIQNVKKRSNPRP
jgi:aminopeptidase-like protein